MVDLRVSAPADRRATLRRLQDPDRPLAAARARSARRGRYREDHRACADLDEPRRAGRPGAGPHVSQLDTGAGDRRPLALAAGSVPCRGNRLGSARRGTFAKTAGGWLNGPSDHKLSTQGARDPDVPAPAAQARAAKPKEGE